MAQKLASAPTRMIVLSAFAMMLLGPSQASAGVFTPIPGPQNSFTGPYGINDSGAISGTYGHSPGTQGFIEKSGVFTAVNFTGNPIDTQLFGINNSGVAVGYSRFANGDIDFVYDHGQFSQRLFEKGLSALRGRDSSLGCGRPRRVAGWPRSGRSSSATRPT